MPSIPFPVDFALLALPLAVEARGVSEQCGEELCSIPAGPTVRGRSMCLPCLSFKAEKKIEKISPRHFTIVRIANVLLNG